MQIRFMLLPLVLDELRATSQICMPSRARRCSTLFVETAQVVQHARCMFHTVLPMTQKGLRPRHRGIVSLA